MTERPLALDPAAPDPAFALARRQVDGGAAPFTILAVATSAGLVPEAWPAWGFPSARIDGAVQAAYAALR